MQVVDGKITLAEDLVSKLRSRAWEDRHHRRYREEAAREIELLRSRIDRALQQLAASDRYAADAVDGAGVPSVWQLQNGLVRDALSSKE